MNKRETGGRYEQAAAEFLQRAGMRILHRNYRTRAGEIDLIAQDGEYLVFVEVKYRSGDGMGTAQEAVDIRKQKKVAAAARHYLMRYGYGADTPCRFDVIGINGTKITHIQNAFWAEGR